MFYFRSHVFFSSRVVLNRGAPCRRERRWFLNVSVEYPSTKEPGTVDDSTELDGTDARTTRSSAEQQMTTSASLRRLSTTFRNFCPCPSPLMEDKKSRYAKKSYTYFLRPATFVFVARRLHRTIPSLYAVRWMKFNAKSIVSIVQRRRYKASVHLQ